MSRWILWAAVSSLPQARKISNEDQIALGHEHMQRHNGTLVAELIVPGKSRSITLLEDARERIEQYEELYQHIKRKDFDVLGYLDRSRLGRVAALSMTIVALCHEYGIATYEYDNPPSSLNIDDSHDELLIGAIKSVGGEHEVRKLQERRTRGMIGRTLAGKFAKNPIYGYIRDPMSSEYKVIIHPQEAEAIRFIVELYLSGRGQVWISDELKRRGYPTRGGEWEGALVRYMLVHSEKYIGVLTYNTNDPRRGVITAKGNYPDILTPELVAAIKAELKSRSQNRKLSSEQCSILSGICFCSVCGRRMTYRQKDRHICCENKHDGQRYVKFPRIIEELKIAISNMSLPSAEELGLSSASQESRIRESIVTLDENIASALKAKSRASAAFVDGIMEAEEYQAQVKRVQERIARLEGEKLALLNALQDEAHNAGRLQRMEDFRNQALARLEGTDIRAINAWLRGCIKIYIRDGHIEQIDIL